MEDSIAKKYVKAIWYPWVKTFKKIKNVDLNLILYKN